MYAVELRFVADGEATPSFGLIEAGLREHCGRFPGVRLEHLRVRRIGGEAYVVAFIAAPTAAHAEAFAATAGECLAAELNELLFIGFRNWTGG